MNCPSCQAELPDSARFCGACGHQFQTPAAPVAAASSIPTSSRPIQASSSGNSMAARSAQEIAATPIQISYNDLALKSWGACKDQMVPLAIGALVWMMAIGVSYFLSLILIGIPVLCALMAGPIIVGHHLAIGKEVGIGTWFGGFKKLVPMTLLIIVLGIGMFLVGLIGGITAMFGLSLPLLMMFLFMAPIATVSVYLTLDRDLGFMDALKESFEVVKAQPVDFFVMGSAVNMVMMLGSGVFGIGGLVTMPVALMMMGVWLNQVLGSQGGLNQFD